MTIGPKKKVSKVQSRKRHSTWKSINLKRLENTYQTAKCPNCGANRLNHRVCPSCGYYNGKQVLTIKSKAKDTVVDAQSPYYLALEDYSYGYQKKNQCEESGISLYLRALFFFCNAKKSDCSAI